MHMKTNNLINYLLAGAVSVLLLGPLGCGSSGGNANAFVGYWVKGHTSMTINPNGDQLIIDYQDAELGTRDKLIASYSQGKLTTTFPLVGPTTLAFDRQTGNLIFSGVGEFKKADPATGPEARHAALEILNAVKQAKNQVAVEKHLKAGDPVIWNDLKEYINNVDKLPNRDDYQLNPIGTDPVSKTFGDLLTTR